MGWGSTLGQAGPPPPPPQPPRRPLGRLGRRLGFSPIAATPHLLPPRRHPRWPPASHARSPMTVAARPCSLRSWRRTPDLGRRSPPGWRRPWVVLAGVPDHAGGGTAAGGGRGVEIPLLVRSEVRLPSPSAPSSLPVPAASVAGLVWMGARWCEFGTVGNHWSAGPARQQRRPWAPPFLLGGAAEIPTLSTPLPSRVKAQNPSWIGR